MEEILLNIESKEIRCAQLKNGVLWDLTIERKKNRPIAGNIYRGKVTSILHNIQSAFIDINEGENGFIHISDIIENTQKFQEMFDMDFDWDIKKPSKEKKAENDISKLLKADQPVLVEVVKEAMGTKGARLTSNITLPGRYLVLLPNTPHRGVSRKIEDPGAREKLKKFIRSFEMPGDMGLICRTASVNATAETLIAEATELLSTWKSIVENFNKATKPTLLYQEWDLLKRSAMMAIDKRYGRIMTDDYSTFQKLKNLVSKYSDEHQIKVELYRDKAPMFERFGVEREIEKAIQRKIWLPGGGYLFFDRTEAMYTVDVNSGRSSGHSGHDVEESLVQINMQAAEEIARQLRLRNIGGLVICDFIDMRSKKNQRRVLDRIKEAMKDDTAKCTILGMSEFGLVEMTRQRSRESLTQTMFSSCPYCQGSGMIKSLETTAIDIERSLKKLIKQQEQFALELVCHPEMEHYLSHTERSGLKKFAEKANAALKCSAKDTLHLNDYYFISTTNGKKLDV